jgi:hypothetical protein
LPGLRSSRRCRIARVDGVDRPGDAVVVQDLGPDTEDLFYRIRTCPVLDVHERVGDVGNYPLTVEVGRVP